LLDLKEKITKPVSIFESIFESEQNSLHPWTSVDPRVDPVVGVVIRLSRRGKGGGIDAFRWLMVVAENWTAVFAIVCLVGLLVATAKCIESREAGAAAEVGAGAAASGSAAATSSRRQEAGGQRGYGTVKTEYKSEGNKFITNDDL
jgi:hypothetical protein